MACVKVCKRFYPTAPSHTIIAAVHGARCGCSFDMDLFTEVPAELCTYPCKFYKNPICGGAPDYWGIFKEYDFQSMASHGAYDPWRYVFYTVVVMLEKTMTGTTVLNKDAYQTPERYFLHAANTQTGDALFQFQHTLPGIVHGLQYDLDSTRLVGILTPQETGRSVTREWEYQLLCIK
eukprot:gnl/TRDRNA2_/TRDRNA2_153030_c0_seq1.p1 gnl/TRDRNA2_/TRDRNA2_153030_c0~~gnl/TRDRNA2_/TRDRNA2_153030_c0_seq1.p1  ORF type:complete len:186 (-),score=24.89 gnl/TRDRNA2_/TRDRNA2_153030_c0_seq1:16-549(-)